jgi:Flp pilus assembly protein TadD
MFDADIKLRSGNTAEATNRLQTVLKDQPDNARAHFLLGLAYERSANADQAEKEWRQAAKLRPDMIPAQEALAKLAARKGDVDLLASTADQLIKLQPSSPNGYLYRAAAENARQQAAASEADIQTAIRLAPQDPSAYAMLAKLRLFEKKYPEALTNFQLALDRDPNSADALAGIAQVYVAQKLPNKAISAVAAQIAKSPANSNFYSLLGSLQAGNHDQAAAEASFQKAVDLNGNNFPALSELGRMQMLQDKLDKAAQSWLTLAQKDPRNPQPYVLLGTLEDSRNNWQKAQEYYQKALQIRPDFASAANNLAYSMLEHSGNPDVALTLAQTARHGMPDSPNSADTLAWAYIQKKVYGSAIDLLQDAIKKSPPNATFEFHLGVAYQGNGNAAEAKKHLNKALVLDPKFSQAAEVRKALQELSHN